MTSNRFRPNLLALQQRNTPAYTSTLQNTTAELFGDGASEQFRISESKGLLVHNRPTSEGFASNTDWDTSKAGTQTLAASATSSVRFFNLGDGDDEVVLGTGSSPASSIRAEVIIVTGGPGNDKLFIDTLANTTGLTFDCTKQTFQATGVNVSHGLNEVSTTLFLGSGPDRVNITGTAFDFRVQGNGGADQVSIGQLALLNGDVRVENIGPAAETTIFIDDSASTTARSFGFLDSGANTKVELDADSSVIFTASQVTSLMVQAGSGTDSFTYRATRGATSTVLLGGDGGDIFEIAPPAGAFGMVGLGGQGGSDFIQLNNPLPVGFSLNANGGFATGLDKLTVLGTSVSTVTVTHESLTSGTVAGIGNPVAFNNMSFVTVSGSPNTLILNMPTAVSHTLRLGVDSAASGRSSLTGSTIPTTEFNSPSVSLTVNLGDAGSTINMQAMDSSFAPAGTGLEPGGTLLRGGAGADSFFVLPDFNSTTRVDGGGPTTSPGDHLSVQREFRNPSAATPTGSLGSGPGSLSYTNIEDLSLTFTDDQLVVGTDRGAAWYAQYDPDPTLLFRGTAFTNSTGGARVAMGDFNGDGEPDIVLGTGPGGPTRVRVLDGNTRDELFAIDPFESTFVGGVYVAAGDITGDGIAELVITPDEGGGPRVRVFDGDNNFTQIADYFAIDDKSFRGGARPAVGDINQDSFAELVVAAGFGGGPRVAVFQGNANFNDFAPKLVGDFFVFEQTLRNGIFIAVGDVNADGFGDLVSGGGPGGGPRVLVLSGVDLLAGKADQSSVLANFFAGDPNSRGGVRVSTSHLDQDARMDLVTGAGQNSESLVRTYLGSALVAGTPPTFLDLNPFMSFSGGVFVG